MKIKNKDFTTITERDYEVVKFLWKWKVSTTAALTLKFFPNTAPHTAYNRLLELEKRKVILGRADLSGKYFVWTLTADGNARCKNSDIHLKDDGYRSEYPAHDLLVAAAHNGDWLLSKPENIEIFTEQQIRRYASDAYPSWVPTLDIHRPDGYWRIHHGDSARTIALEVELHHKAKSDYRRVALFYNHFTSIRRVLWIIPQASTARHLAKELENKDDEWNPHIFTTVAEFEEHGWAAPILVGHDTGSTIAEVLGAKTTKPTGSLRGFPHESAVNRSELNLVEAMLNVSKSPHKSMTQKFFMNPGSRQQ